MFVLSDKKEWNKTEFTILATVSHYQKFAKYHMKLPLPKSVRLKQITNFPTPFLLVSCILMGQFFISWRLVITLTACQLVQTFLTNITKFALFVTHCQWDFQRPTWMLVSRDFQRFPEISKDFQRFQESPECLSQPVTKEELCAVT